MDKVKVTQDQAEAIENLKRGINGISHNIMEEQKEGWFFNVYKPLNEISNLKVVSAILNGYEVEPEFKVGDWVAWEAFDGKLVGRVLLIDEFDKVIKTDIRNGNGVKQQFSFGHSELRHATPSEIAEVKERRFWQKHGREVREIKLGDVLERDGNSFIVNQLPLFKDEREDLKNRKIKVICFAEKRLDL